MGGGEGLAAGAGLYPLLGVFGVVESKKYQPTFQYHWDQFQTHAFHVVPSMGPIVSVMTLHDQ